MHKVTFTGANSSLKKYGIRFEPGKPQMIEDAELAGVLESEHDFEVEKVEDKTSSASGDDKEQTLTALKDQAKEAKIEGYTKMDKEQLIEALKKHAEQQSNDDPYVNAPTS